jgi:CMP-N,N'-diacetyllegionaminic acid synthase
MNSDRKILAIIPARGGSKSIPGKNIRPLLGKPLIAYSIEEAKKSKYIDKVIVSTDYPEIAEIGKKYGAEVPFLRPKEISGDKALDIDFYIHALDFLKEKENYEPELVLRLAPTSPLRTAESIDEGIETILNNPELDSVRSITEAPKHPYKMYTISEDKKNINPFLSKAITNMDEPYNMPRQILPDVYVHTGAIDISRLKTLREMNSLTGSKIGYFFMKPEDSVNIDYEVDFAMAEFFMKNREKQG